MQILLNKKNNPSRLHHSIKAVNMTLNGDYFDLPEHTPAMAGFPETSRAIPYTQDPRGPRPGESFEEPYDPSFYIVKAVGIAGYKKGMKELLTSSGTGVPTNFKSQVYNKIGELLYSKGYDKIDYKAFLTSYVNAGHQQAEFAVKTIDAMDKQGLITIG